MKHQALKEKVAFAKATLRSGASPEAVSHDPTIASLNALSGSSQPASTNIVAYQRPRNSEKREVVMVCHYHDGQIIRGNWSCCHGHSQFSKPCKSAERHQPADYSTHWLIAQWQYYPTPILNPWRLPQLRGAVVLDCEFGVSIHGDSELISLAVIDYFSGEVLINRLVLPKVRMLHYNTPFSGIRNSDIESARRTGTCFRGRDEARIALYSYVSPDTIVVGHALHQDLSSMRLIHKKVIDTLILEQNIAETCRIDTVNIGKVDEEPGNEDGGAALDGSASKKSEKRKSGSLSLKALAHDRLGREIQVGSHDALEDAIATRDLCHWYMLNVVGKMQPVGLLADKERLENLVENLTVTE
ncbi:hypothetical protein jhhlp_002106 [Lomentospora prolificans]|uniref:Exonuclease domain-containing protein n=1 Tax=Lomentospora prolificans TaxID=41688 RepID=A0A2N3ND32_9PEZI|nr:hypothetical protein jhhlp_002106 [Lomentospora prolificans]